MESFSSSRVTDALALLWHRSSAFPAADTNGDGCVDAAEFAAFERENGLLVENDPIKDLKKPAIEFWASFGNSVIMIIVTELGDKTFFIAAILAMQYDRCVRPLAAGCHAGFSLPCG